MSFSCWPGRAHWRAPIANRVLHRPASASNSNKGARRQLPISGAYWAPAQGAVGARQQWGRWASVIIRRQFVHCERSIEPSAGQRTNFALCCRWPAPRSGRARLHRRRRRPNPLAPATRRRRNCARPSGAQIERRPIELKFILPTRARQFDWPAPIARWRLASWPLGQRRSNHLSPSQPLGRARARAQNSF